MLKYDNMVGGEGIYSRIIFYIILVVKNILYKILVNVVSGLNVFFYIWCFCVIYLYGRRVSKFFEFFYKGFIFIYEDRF